MNGLVMEGVVMIDLVDGDVIVCEIRHRRE